MPDESAQAAKGGAAEALAGELLRRTRKFRLVEYNWRNPADRREEIDLIAWDEEVLVFVEVKARDASARVPGFFAVDVRKRKALRRPCLSYLRAMSKRPRTFRFDVVEVEMGGQRPVLRHFENISLFSKWDR